MQLPSFRLHVFCGHAFSYIVAFVPLPSLQVKSKNKEVQLHKDSPLGDAVLECYASGSRNVFVLGFVPVKAENTVVLLARDTPLHHPTIKDLNLDLTQWQPIVEERALVR